MYEIRDENGNWKRKYDPEEWRKELNVGKNRYL